MSYSLLNNSVPLARHFVWDGGWNETTLMCFTMVTSSMINLKVTETVETGWHEVALQLCF